MGAHALLGASTHDTLLPNLMECPPNFGRVGSQIYRSSFLKKEHHDFIAQLHLKSILVLISENYPEENLEFCRRNNITIFQVGLDGNKEPFVRVKKEDLERAIRIVLNPENQPILIHCNQGKHRTGCVVGCIRRLQKISLAVIFEEYRRYAFPKIRSLDHLIIELFDDEFGKQDEVLQAGISQIYL